MLNLRNFAILLLDFSGGIKGLRQVQASDTYHGECGSRWEDRKLFLSLSLRQYRSLLRQIVLRKSRLCFWKKPERRKVEVVVSGWWALANRPLAEKIILKDGHSQAVEYDSEIDYGSVDTIVRPLMWIFMGLYIPAVFLIGLLDKRKHRYSILSSTVGTVLKVGSLRSPDAVYFFSLYLSQDYLAATYLSKRLKLPVVCVFHEQLMSVFSSNFQASTPVIVTADIQRVEAENLRKRGAISVGDIRYYDYYEMFPENVPSAMPHKYDIGFVSSGEWGREGGKKQPPLDMLPLAARGDFADNGPAQKSIELLVILLKWARTNRKTVCVYPHPYERLLMDEYGAKPPWLELVNEAGQYWDDSQAADSLVQISESSVTVSQFSTLSLKRIDLGFMSTFNCAVDFEGTPLIALGDLGKYQRNFFVNFNDLERKIESEFEAING